MDPRPGLAYKRMRANAPGQGAADSDKFWTLLAVPAESEIYPNLVRQSDFKGLNYGCLILWPPLPKALNLNSGHSWQLKMVNHLLS
jgi:hypothetical protein